MQTEQEMKELVRQKYSEIALQDKETNMSSCCGAGGCSTEVYNIMSDDYTKMEGYNADADLGLGCGLPTEFAQIKPGDTVIDLGSGAGNDCFIARAATGPTGRVIGIDFTEAMIEKARANVDKLGYNNVFVSHPTVDKDTNYTFLHYARDSANNRLDFGLARTDKTGTLLLWKSFNVQNKDYLTHYGLKHFLEATPTSYIVAGGM